MLRPLPLKSERIADLFQQWMFKCILLECFAQINSGSLANCFLASFIQQQEQKMIGKHNMLQYFCNTPSGRRPPAKKLFLAVKPAVKHSKSADELAVYFIYDRFYFTHDGKI